MAAFFLAFAALLQPVIRDDALGIPILVLGATPVSASRAAAQNREILR
jgi:hypothetical protein